MCSWAISSRISTVLKTHFEPKSLTIAERFKFNHRDQQAGELIKRWLILWQREEKRYTSSSSCRPVLLVVHGTVPIFTTQEETEWIKYTKRLENYFLGKDITEVAKRKATLLNAVGLLTYCLIKTLVIPGKPTDLTFHQVTNGDRSVVRWK